jgi:hypothetical protein
LVSVPMRPVPSILDSIFNCVSQYLVCSGFHCLSVSCSLR